MTIFILHERRLNKHVFNFSYVALRPLKRRQKFKILEKVATAIHSGVYAGSGPT